MDNNTERNNNKITSILRLIKIIWEGSKSLFLIEIFLTLIVGLLPVTTALIWQLILEAYDSSQYQIVILFLLMALSGGLLLSNGYFREVIDTIFRNRLSKNLQKKVHNKAAKISMDYYEMPILNDLINRASETFFYGDAIGFIVVIFYALQMFFSLIMTGFLVWTYNPILIVPLLILMFIQIIGLKLNKRKLLLELELAPLRRECDIYRKYMTQYQSAKEMRLLDAYEIFEKKWVNILNEIINREEKQTRINTILQICKEIVERFTTIFAYLLCMYLVIKGEIDIAKFGALIVLLQQFFQNTMTFLNYIQELHSNAVFGNSSLEFFDLPEEKREFTISNSLNNIEFDNVFYKYPEMDKYAVRNINLKLNNNEIIAIVGNNGSGKSTIAKLLTGLIVPTEGIVKHNGSSTSTIEYSSLFANTTAVFQDFSKYLTNIRDNIIISDTHKQLTDEEILKYIASINIDFLSENSNIDLNTLLGVEYGGVELSGGQWQQLAIARAQYKKASLIILDEPTASIDPIKETQLFETFRKLCKGKIGIIITHRLSLCKLADYIIVMENGCIMESGSHSQLMSNNKKYADIYLKQASMYGETT